MKLVAKDEDTNDWSCLVTLGVELNKHGITYPVNFVSGIFTAILSYKERVPTQRWVKLFMAESNTDNIDVANELLQALMDVYNKIAMQLYDDKFEPAFLESMKILDWHEGSEKSLMDWCFGYCKGMDLCPAIWIKEQYEYSMPMAIFGGAIGKDKIDSLTNEVLSELAEMIPSMAQSVYNIAFDARADERELQSGKNKLGRNDPCPCGSGKKYKKCCLGEEELETIH